MTGRSPVALSVVVEPRARGYVCAMYLGEELLRVLDRDGAAAYCAEWTWAITCAEHDAAVTQHLTARGIPKRYVVQAVRHLRNDRRPILAAALDPVEDLATIVSAETKQGLINGRVRQVPFQWDLDMARTHVMYVAEVSAGVDLDTAYAAHLRGVIGLDDTEAHAAVIGLRSFMPSSSHTHDDPPNPTP